MGETKLSNRRTNRNIILSVGATLVAKLMVLLQSSVISSVFGANEGVDLIFYMMSLAVVVTTFSSAVNQLVIVSNIIHVRDNRSPQEYRQTVRFFFSLYLIVATVLAGALMLFPGQVLGALTSFEPEVIAANLGIIRVMAMVLFFSVLNTYVMDVFTSHRVFILPMVNDVIKSLAIILFILLPGQNTRIEMIVWGMLVAHIIQFLTINISFRRVFGFAVYPGFTRSMEKNAKKNVASVLLAQSASSLESMAMMGVASSFPAGYYVSFSLARKIFTAVMNVVILQFATVVGIDLIEHNATDNPQKLSNTFTGYLKTGNYIMLPIMVVSMVNAPAIISLLFGYGRFTQENVTIAATLLRVLSLSMITFLWDSFLQRLVVAKQLNHKTFIFQIMQSLLRIGLYFFLYNLLGYVGVGFGLVIGNLAYDIALGLYLFKGEYRFIKLKDTFRFVFANLLFAGVAGLAGMFCSRFFTYGMGFVGNFVYLCATTAVIFAMYFFGGLLFRPNRNTLSVFLQMAGRLFRRKRKHQ